MKKFFEASIVSRKNVKGKVVLTVQALSAGDENLGELMVKTYKEESKSGLFFQYVPSQAADGNEPITAFKIITKNPESVSMLLEGIKEAVRQKALEDLTYLMVASIINDCIDSQAGRITIPSFASEAGVNITNDIICGYLGDEWIGGEMKVLPELQKAIMDLAGEKRLLDMMQK